MMSSLINEINKRNLILKNISKVNATLLEERPDQEERPNQEERPDKEERPDQEERPNKDQMLTQSNIGFIILRHVNSESNNNYWIHCYNCIRKFYPENNILIIDDNSNYEYIKNEILYKTIIIQSEFPQRGEILPYYYYLNYKIADIAIILHDSVFINEYIDFNIDFDIKFIDNYKYKFIWYFHHGSDQINDELSMIKLFNDPELLDFYNNKRLWKGCFGAMTIISHDYLTFINEKYDISRLLDKILNRYNRCSFERVFACLLQKNHKMDSLFGNIHWYCKWGITFDQKDKYNDLPLIKVWSGR